MDQKTVYIVSLGCAKNLVDTEYILGEFTRLGYTVVSEPDRAETILVNTCAFIESAVEEAVDVILDMAEFKRLGSCRKLFVAGCLPQRYGGELQRGMPEVDVFFGPGELEGIQEFLQNGQRDIRSIAPFGLPRNITPSPGLSRGPATPFYTSFLKISEGCDNRCTFCTIPMIRGPYRSVAPELLLREARDLAARGVVELNVVAQDTTRYGEDLPDKTDLSRLLRQVCEVDGFQWVRVLYMYPERVTDRLFQTMRSVENLLPYFDLPFQHVSPAIVKKMGRNFNNFDPLELVRKIRDFLPDAAVRSTLMVGFPGETDTDFQMLIDFVRQARLDHLGVFIYSPEEGTAASRLHHRVPKKEKESRYRAVMELQAAISRSINESRVGSVARVLVEGPSRETDLLLQGRASFQAPDIDGLVYINSGRAIVGRIFPVRITQAGDYDLVGEVE